MCNNGSYAFCSATAICAKVFFSEALESRVMALYGIRTCTCACPRVPGAWLQCVTLAKALLQRPGTPMTTD